jgi:hypothetical protein
VHSPHISQHSNKDGRKRQRRISRDDDGSILEYHAISPGRRIARDTMASKGMIPFLVGMMLLTGVCNTLLTKFQVRMVKVLASYS